MGAKESGIQRAILARLAMHPEVHVIPRASKCCVSPVDAAAKALEQGRVRLVLWRQNTGAVTVPGTHGRARRHVAYSLPGAPDIAGLLAPGGQSVGMEVKTEQGQQSDSQVAYASMLIAAGGLYEVVQSVEEALRVVDFWLVRATLLAGHDSCDGSQRDG